MKVNYYEVLGVDRTASEQQIRDRFRTLARENHPDRYRGADKAAVERKFQTLTEAVNVPGISYTCAGLRFAVAPPSPNDHSYA